MALVPVVLAFALVTAIVMIGIGVVTVSSGKAVTNSSCNDATTTGVGTGVMIDGTNDIDIKWPAMRAILLSSEALAPNYRRYRFAGLNKPRKATSNYPIVIETTIVRHFLVADYHHVMRDVPQFRGILLFNEIAH